MSFLLTEDACSICKTHQDSTSNLTSTLLLVNSHPNCGHKFCKTCSDKEFSRKRQFSCPICNSIVKRQTLSEKSVHEIQVNEDFQIRKRVNEIYNKGEHDFPTLLEYCNYQEMVEDIVYDLTNKINVEEIEKKISQYRAENKDTIQLRNAQLAEHERRTEQRIRLEREQAWELKQNLEELDRQEKQNQLELKKQKKEISLGERDKLSEHLTVSLQGGNERSAGGGMSRLMESAITGDTSLSGEQPPPVMQQAPTMLDHHRFRREAPKPLPHEKRPADRNAPPGAVAAVGGFSRSINLDRNWTETLSTMKSFFADKKNVLNDEAPVWAPRYSNRAATS